VALTNSQRGLDAFDEYLTELRAGEPSREIAESSETSSEHTRSNLVTLIFYVKQSFLSRDPFGFWSLGYPRGTRESDVGKRLCDQNGKIL